LPIAQRDENRQLYHSIRNHPQISERARLLDPEAFGGMGCKETEGASLVRQKKSEPISVFEMPGGFCFTKDKQ